MPGRSRAQHRPGDRVAAVAVIHWVPGGFAGGGAAAPWTYPSAAPSVRHPASSPRHTGPSAPRAARRRVHEQLLQRDVLHAWAISSISSGNITIVVFQRSGHRRPASPRCSPSCSSCRTEVPDVVDGRGCRALRVALPAHTQRDEFPLVHDRTRESGHVVLVPDFLQQLAHDFPDPRAAWPMLSNRTTLTVRRFIRREKSGPGASCK